MPWFMRIRQQRQPRWVPALGNALSCDDRQCRDHGITFTQSRAPASFFAQDIGIWQRGAIVRSVSNHFHSWNKQNVHCSPAFTTSGKHFVWQVEHQSWFSTRTNGSRNGVATSSMRHCRRRAVPAKVGCKPEFPNRGPSVSSKVGRLFLSSSVVSTSPVLAS